MSCFMKNYLKSDKYKGVYSVELIKNSSGSSNNFNGKKFYAVKMVNYKKWKSKFFDKEIDAAKAYDLKLIEFGLEPVNILKRK